MIMLKIIERETVYTLKKDWFDFDRQVRTLGVEKNLLDTISDLIEEDEIAEIKFDINSGEKIFNREEFEKGEDNLTRNECRQIVKELEIHDYLVNTGELITITQDGKTKTKAKVVLKSRIVYIKF